MGDETKKLMKNFSKIVDAEKIIGQFNYYNVQYITNLCIHKYY